MFFEKNDLSILALVQDWIKDLLNAGMTYSRISCRVKLSPSTVQKIATKNRRPRIKTLSTIGTYYLKIFESPQSYGFLIENYYLKNKDTISNTILMTKFLLKILPHGNKQNRCV